MLNSEIEKMIKNLVKTAKEYDVGIDEIKYAIDKEYNKKQNVVEVVDKNEITDKIWEFVTLILPPRSGRAETLLAKRDTVKFVVTSLVIYYQLAKMNNDNFVDVNGEWINQIALALNYAKPTVYTKIHNELKPCLADYMKLPSYSKKIKDIMAEFYDKHLSKW